MRHQHNYISKKEFDGMVKKFLDGFSEKVDLDIEYEKIKHKTSILSRKQRDTVTALIEYKKLNF